MAENSHLIGVDLGIAGTKAAIFEEEGNSITDQFAQDEKKEAKERGIDPYQVLNEKAESDLPIIYLIPDGRYSWPAAKK